MRLATPALLLALALLGGAGEVLAQAGGIHESEELGYKVRYPKGFSIMPISAEERWIVARYLSDREYVDKEEGWGFKPSMTVIVFPFSVTKDRGVEKKEVDDGTVLTIKNPYRDYRDYLKKTYSGGGWYIDVEKEMKTRDLDWTLYEIKVEKLAYGGKKRIVAGIFHAGDADFVVQFEILEQNAKKHRNMIMSCLKSFRFIPRKGSLAPTASGETVKITDESKLTPRERAKLREERQRIAFRKSVKKLPAGWTSFESDGFLVLTHVGRKYSMRVVKQAAAVRKWLDKAFPYLGDEYVRPPILRICDSLDEENSYRGTGSFFSSSREIVTHQDVGAGAKSFEFEYVVRRVVDAWFYDKDTDLYLAMPKWLASGLYQYVGTATLKGSRLEFKPDQWELELLRNARQAGELTPVRDLLVMTGEPFWQKPHHSAEAASLLRFLLDGPGRGLKGAKSFLEDYFRALLDFVRERKKKEEAEGDEGAGEGPKTEEEEEKEFERRQRAWKEREGELLKGVFDRAFGGWSESTWKRLEQSYRKFIS